MSVIFLIMCFIVSISVASSVILYFVRKEVSFMRREVVHLYAELKQDISSQQFQIELLKKSVKGRSLILGEVLEEPWVKELMEE